VNAPCPTCQRDVLTVTTDTGTRTLDATPDPSGTFEVRRSGGGLRARPIGRRTDATPGHVKHASHQCAEAAA
jgi:hypothetical protein